jgi:hypothetical protein
MPARPVFPQTRTCAAAAFAILLTVGASAAPKVQYWRALEGRTTDTRSITPTVLKVFTMPDQQCPHCVSLKWKLKEHYPKAKYVVTKARRSMYTSFPAVLYSDGWVDNGERIRAGQYQLYPYLKPVLEFVEVGE